MSLFSLLVLVLKLNAFSIAVADFIFVLESKCAYLSVVLEQDETEMNKNWNKRYRDNMDKLKSGDIYEIADVVRNLSFKQKEKGLSTGEKKMLTNAKQILVSELVLAEHSNKDEMEELVDNKINNSFITFRAGDTVKESVVSKFIPFDGSNNAGTSENT